MSPGPTPARVSEVMVVRFGPWFPGALAWARSPRGARAWVRVRPVLLPNSSTQTQRLGSIAVVSLRQARRAASTRSLAWRDFFSRPTEVADDHPAHGGNRDLHAVGRGPTGTVFREGVRGVGLELGQQARPERPDLAGRWPGPRRLGQVARLPSSVEPALDGAERDHVTVRE